MDLERQRREVDVNYGIFQRKLATYLNGHEDEFALLRDGQVIGFFATSGDASREAWRRFDDGIYSIQEVTAQPIDLGIFSHAGS